ncbi:polysaccharide deacetylase family protein [Armatimonas rosea]|uniref:Peptidoglycan/xylan/chitin deacetylase (PgdA/CDA1 family) n=1 Tax=Armatimonas rosea TaxID=685828 RepID=A0A7W9SRW2_ARMRO|nr:polysaccharide deacetylase family protein [Armatimonas rosea]MBB6051280.1 peptidoglycan/xylan/chitin deacetylase (PgdA/CDA1 family) [Armatimonas rosea]
MKKSLCFLALAAVALSGAKCPSRTQSSAPPTETPATPERPATPGPFDPTIFGGISPRAQGRRIPVIMYHDIVATKKQKTVFFDCTADEFKDQIAYLEKQGAQFISVEQLQRHLVRGDEVPEKAVLLTFDDNYLGFYKNAYPLLKEKKIPSVMFVHTAFVGNTKGPHPKMSWETLKQLDSEKLVTIGSHTVTHPGEFEKLPLDVQQTELADAKQLLEAQLGHPVTQIAYPEGRGDAQTFALAQQIGYTLGFTVENGPAEQSPSILAVNRYIHTRLQKAWEECQRITVEAPAAVFERDLAETPVRLETGTYDGIKLVLVKGGRPLTVRATDTGRKSVGEFIRDTPNTVAGMNGTFFVNADLRSVDNALIGPCRTQIENAFFADEDKLRMPRIWNRPLVVWGPKKIAIVPFNPYANNDEVSLLSLMPNMSDVFLGGAWIVHDGVARTKKEIGPYAARDFNDPRKRAFFGVTDKGEPVLGATMEVITTEMMAKGAAAAGVHEAVLMDSGFSTSIVYDGKIIATGHTAKDLPSRPVPHAILLSGTLQQPTDPDTLTILQGADASVGSAPSTDVMRDLPVTGARPEGDPDRGKLGRRRRR